MAFNISDYPTNLSDVSGIFIWANDQVSGLIGVGFLVIFFVVSFVTMKAFESKKPFAASAFGTSIVAGLFWGLGLIQFRVAGFAILLAGFGFIWLLFSDT